MKTSWDREASKTTAERSRVDCGFVFVVAVVAAADVVVVVVVETCSKTLSSRTGASVRCTRSCWWRPLSCWNRRRRRLLARMAGARAAGEKRRGDGRLERVEGPAAAAPALAVAEG